MIDDNWVQQGSGAPTLLHRFTSTISRITIIFRDKELIAFHNLIASCPRLPNTLETHTHSRHSLNAPDQRRVKALWGFVSLCVTNSHAPGYPINYVDGACSTS
jgi:hypothetical protein